MNTLEQLNLSQPLTDVYTAMETDIMMAIARQLARDGEISSTSEWRMKKLAESGALSRETAQIIASYTGIQSDLLTLTIEQAAAKVTDKLEPALQAVAKDGFISVKDSTPISAGMKNVVSNFRRQARSDLNLVNTVMQYKANSSYTYLVNKVYSETVENRQELLAALGKHTFEVASGAETRQTAIRNCIKEFAQKGIPAFVDRAGREWSPEAYISMDIRTTVGNTANATQDACCDRYGIDLFAVSSHMGARPKCAPYQGKVISRSNRSGIAHDGDGNEVPYIPLSSTSYGEPDGLFGINCGHNKYPFIDGVSFQRYYPYEKEANAKRCNEFKQQRALERKVRIASREVDMMKEQNDPEGLKAARENLKQLRQEYSKYSADHGLKEHNDRASVVRIRKGDDVFGKIYKNPIGNDTAATNIFIKELDNSDKNDIINVESEFNNPLGELWNKIRSTFDTSSKNTASIDAPSDAELDEALKSIGFVSVDKSFHEKVNRDLQISIADQLKILEDKFGAIKASELPTIAADVAGGAEACTSSYSHNPADQRLRFSKTKFKNKKKHLENRKRDVESFFCMPCNPDDETLSRYVVTHEYGHMLENILVKKNLPSFRPYAPSIEKDFRTEITELAKLLDREYDEDKYLSQYGTKNDKEFFAECFANSQLGQPNVLGHAMRIWLERKGF